MHAVASQEDIMKESQVRETEHLEIHMSEETFDEAREGLKAWQADMPEVANDYSTCVGAEAQEVSDIPAILSCRSLLTYLTEIWLS